jgi:hypothetical protein
VHTFCSRHRLNLIVVGDHDNPMKLTGLGRLSYDMHYQREAREQPHVLSRHAA